MVTATALLHDTHFIKERYIHPPPRPPAKDIVISEQKMSPWHWKRLIEWITHLMSFVLIVLLLMGTGEMSSGMDIGP